MREDAPPMSLKMFQDLRWGDSGKGKIMGYVTHPDFTDVSVRMLGVNNAGNVIQQGTRKAVTHQLPAGCIYEGVDLVQGRGMGINPRALFEEITEIRNKFATDPELRLVIAPESHIVLNLHIELDKYIEKLKDKDAVGTTQKGVGPMSAGKDLRLNMRMEDLRLPSDQLKDRYQKLRDMWNKVFGIQMKSDLEQQDVDTLSEAKNRLEKRVHPDIDEYWQQKFAENARIVLGGSQGSKLSINAPGYPFVTSSPTTVLGHLDGAGIPLSSARFMEVIGVIKAYDTRVGNGEFQTEFTGEKALELCKRGNEFGSTTSRPRRIGWLDAKDVKKEIWRESVTALCVNKGDVLDTEKEIPVSFDSNPDGSPLYENFRGWPREPIEGMRDWSLLPEAAQFFYKSLERYFDRPIKYIGTGPDNDDLIIR